MKKYIILIIITGCISCKSKKILFQDNFETYTYGMLPGDVWEKSGFGKVMIDTSKSYSGLKSVKFISGEGYKNRAFIGIKHIFPVVNNRYYGSLKLYVTQASPDGIHWTMIQSSGKVAPQGFRAEVRYGGQHEQRLMANYDTKGVASDCWQHASIKIPEKEWCTLQWFFDGNANTMKLWLNDVLIEEITVVHSGAGCLADGTGGIWAFPIFEDLLLGWVDYQTGGGNRKLWIDDVKIWQD